MQRAWSLLLLSLALSTVSVAQDNGGWWRKLFKPASPVPEAEAPAAADTEAAAAMAPARAARLAVAGGVVVAT